MMLTVICLLTLAAFATGQSCQKQGNCGKSNSGCCGPHGRWVVRCQCDGPWRGPHCETNCCSKPNGRYSAKLDKCICRKGFRGKCCTIKKPTTPTTPATTTTTESTTSHVYTDTDSTSTNTGTTTTGTTTTGDDTTSTSTSTSTSTTSTSTSTSTTSTTTSADDETTTFTFPPVLLSSTTAPGFFLSTPPLGP